MIDLAAGFARVGLFGFGGGPSMIPLMQAECVGAGWVTEEQFLEGLAVGNTLPGPIATKMALYVGWTAGGWTGAAAALIGVLLPSALLMTLAASILVQYRDHPVMRGALSAAKPAVIGMLAWTAFSLAPAGIDGPLSGAIALGAGIALLAGAHPGLVMGGALALGAAFLRP